MKRIYKIGKYIVYQLDKETTIKYVNKIAKLADQIPQVTYTEKEILAESKLNRTFYGK